MNIDPTDYVEAETSLRFSNEKQQAKFELGVCMAVYKWEELNTAVENSWGGANSAEKRDWLSGIVIELFDEKVVDIQLIEETLLYAMVDEFDTEIDNDSALEIAALIFKIYKEISQNNPSTVDILYKKWQQKQGNKSSHKVVVDADPNNPDVSDSEEEEEDEDEEMGDAPAQPARHEPIVDDDGFELVQRRR